MCLPLNSCLHEQVAGIIAEFPEEIKGSSQLKGIKNVGKSSLSKVLFKIYAGLPQFFYHSNASTDQVDEWAKTGTITGLEDDEPEPAQKKAEASESEAMAMKFM